MEIVTPTDGPKSIRNPCVIEIFVAFVLSRCFLNVSVGVGTFVIGLNQISSFFFYIHEMVERKSKQNICKNEEKRISAWITPQTKEILLTYKSPLLGCYLAIFKLNSSHDALAIAEINRKKIVFYKFGIHDFGAAFTNRGIVMKKSCSGQEISQKSCFQIWHKSCLTRVNKWWKHDFCTILVRFIPNNFRLGHFHFGIFANGMLFTYRQRPYKWNQAWHSSRVMGAQR